jgi:hypothetical protein
MLATQNAEGRCWQPSIKAPAVPRLVIAMTLCHATALDTLDCSATFWERA